MLDGLRRIDVGGGDQAHVDRLFFLSAEPPDGSLLQHAQQLRLDAGRHLGDLVEEQRARVSKLEAAWPPLHRARKGAPFVTEDFVLEQRLGNRRTVDRDERMFAASAQLVNRLRDELLARPRFAVDEHRCDGRRGLLDDAIDRPKRRGVAHHLPESPLFLQLVPQARDLAQRALPLGDVAQERTEPLGIDRFGEVVVRAFLHRRNSRVHAPLRGDQHECQVGQLILDAPEQLEAIHPRHDHVGEHGRRPIRRDALEAVLSVRRAFGFIPPGAHQFRQPAPGGCIILHDQHSHSLQDISGEPGASACGYDRRNCGCGGTRGPGLAQETRSTRTNGW